MEPPYRPSSNTGRGDSRMNGGGYGGSNNSSSPYGHGHNGHGNGQQNGHGAGPPPEKRRRRRNRWEPVDDRVVEAQNLRVRLDQISRMIATRQIPVQELCPYREPSPPPRYDNRGKRVNTRLDRAREKLETERFKIVLRLREIDPNFRPPPGLKPPKVVEKLIIPKEKEGTVNFIGLILGPRGKTQKRLEKEYQCRVAIRGKGSVKDGRASRNNNNSMNSMNGGDADQLHVLISAEGLDAHERIAQCKQKIMDIIKPRPDELNDHKQAQLRELAQLNGTLRDHDRDRFNFAPNGTPSAGLQPNAPTTQELEGDFQSLIGAIDGNNTAPGTIKSEAKAEATALNVNGNSNESSYPWNLPGAIAIRPQPPPNQVPMPHPGHISAIRGNGNGYNNHNGHRYHNNNNNRNHHMQYSNDQNMNPAFNANIAAAARLAQNTSNFQGNHGQAAPSWMTARPAAHRNFPGPSRPNSGVCVPPPGAPPPPPPPPPPSSPPPPPPPPPM